MKKTVCVMFLLGMTALASAQSPIKKGTMAISGSVSYTRTALEDDAFIAKNFDAEPGFFYYLTNCLALGAEFSYSHHVLESAFSDTETTKRIAVGPGVKFSYPVSSTMVPFLKAVYRYSTSPGAEMKATNKEALIYLGMDFFLNDHVALQPMISYNFAKTEGMNMSTGKTSWIDFNEIAARIGISVFIGN